MIKLVQIRLIGLYIHAVQPPNIRFVKALTKYVLSDWKRFGHVLPTKGSITFFTYVVMSYWQDKELKRRTKENQSGAILVFYSALSTEF